MDSRPKEADSHLRKDIQLAFEAPLAGFQLEIICSPAEESKLAELSYEDDQYNAYSLLSGISDNSKSVQVGILCLSCFISVSREANLTVFSLARISIYVSTCVEAIA